MLFTEVENEAAKPPAFVLVRPEAFKPIWDERPTSPVAIGLRLLSVDDMRSARGVAGASANKAHPTVDADYHPNFPLWVESYNDALMTWIVAHAMCDPNDHAKSWKPFEAAPHDMTLEFMTSGGVQFVYDRWEKMRIDTDPTAPEASDDELPGIFDLIEEKLPHCNGARDARVRRMLAFVAEELRAVDIPTRPS